MPDNDERAADLAAKAEREALGVVSKLLGPASTAAFGRMAVTETGSALKDVAVDQTILKSDLELSRALDETKADAASVTTVNMDEAILAGFRTTAKAEGGEYGLVYRPGSEEDRLLKTYPTSGLTSNEWGKRKSGELDWSIRALLGQVVISSILPKDFMDEVNDKSESWAAAVGRLAADAYFAGVTAARLEMASIIQRR